MRAESDGIAVTRTYGSSETSGGCVYDGVPIGNDLRSGSRTARCGSAARRSPRGTSATRELTAERFVVADGAHWFRTADSGTWDGERAFA